MKKIFGYLFVCMFVTLTSNAQTKDPYDEVQIRAIPEQVKYAFSKQYPNAGNVDYKDKLLTIFVHFTENGSKMMAKYDNNGNWKETEKEFSNDSLPQEIKDGFSKSKYADWKIEETAIISSPDSEDRYRVKVSKSDVQKKYLYFAKNGRLVRDAITI